MIVGDDLGSDVLAGFKGKDSVVLPAPQRLAKIVVKIWSEVMW